MKVSTFIRVLLTVLFVLPCLQAVSQAQQPAVGGRPQAQAPAEDPPPPPEVTELDEPEPVPAAETENPPTVVVESPVVTPTPTVVEPVPPPDPEPVPAEAPKVEESAEFQDEVDENIAPLEEIPPMLAWDPFFENGTQPMLEPIIVEPIVKVVKVESPPAPAIEPGFDFYKLIPSLGDRDASPLPVIILFLLSLFAAFMFRSFRDRLPTAGFIPSALAFAHNSVRVFAVIFGFATAARVIPVHLAPALLWTLVAAAVALGWSSRDVLADLLAYVVIFFERKIRRGSWVEAKGFEGTVESVGPRATWVLDHHGNRVGIPNHQLVGSAVLTDPLGDRAQELTITVRENVSSNIVRQALRDAVLSSPWTHPASTMTLLRDTSDPRVWNVRARMLEASHFAHFEGDLLERAEENIDRLLRNQEPVLSETEVDDFDHPPKSQSNEASK